MIKRKDRVIELISNQNEEQKKNSDAQRKQIKIMPHEKNKKNERVKWSTDLFHKKNNQLIALNERSENRVMKRNELIQIITDDNTHLSFDLKLSLSEAENSTKIVERERDHEGRLLCTLVVMNIAIETLVNGTVPSAACKKNESTCRLTC